MPFLSHNFCCSSAAHGLLHCVTEFVLSQSLHLGNSSMIMNKGFSEANTEATENSAFFCQLSFFISLDLHI